MCYWTPKFLEPCDWSISCEKNYLEGLKTTKEREQGLCLVPFACPAPAIQETE